MKNVLALQMLSTQRDNMPEATSPLCSIFVHCDDPVTSLIS